MRSLANAWTPLSDLYNKKQQSLRYQPQSIATNNNRPFRNQNYMKTCTKNILKILLAITQNINQNKWEDKPTTSRSMMRCLDGGEAEEEEEEEEEASRDTAISSCWRAWTLSGERAQPMTAWPRLANSRESARPRPRLTPVTSTVFRGAASAFMPAAVDILFVAVVVLVAAELHTNPIPSIRSPARASGPKCEPRPRFKGFIYSPASTVTWA